MRQKVFHIIVTVLADWVVRVGSEDSDVKDVVKGVSVMLRLEMKLRVSVKEEREKKVRVRVMVQMVVAE